MPPITNNPDLLGPSELSAHLGGVPVGTLAQWRYLGKGPRFIKMGKHIRYRRSDVDTWLDAHTVGGAAS